MLKGHLVNGCKEKQGVEALKVRWDIAQQPVDKIYVKLVPRESSSY